MTEVDFDAHPFRVKVYDNEYRTKALIIATGASPRKLDVPGEVEVYRTGRELLRHLRRVFLPR